MSFLTPLSRPGFNQMLIFPQSHDVGTIIHKLGALAAELRLRLRLRRATGLYLLLHVSEACEGKRVGVIENEGTNRQAPFVSPRLKTSQCHLRA